MYVAGNQIYVGIHGMIMHSIIHSIIHNVTQSYGSCNATLLQQGLGDLVELVEIVETLEFSFEVQAQTLQYTLNY